MEGRTNSRSQHEVSRRQTLSALGATGTAVSGLAGVPTAVVGDSGREKRITILAAGEESHETVSVSKRWYKHKQQALKVKEALSNRHSDERDLHSVGIERGGRTIDGLRSKRVLASFVPGASQEAKDAVPSSVEGIPVRTEESERPEQTDCYTGASYDGDNDTDEDVYGGRAVRGVKNINDGDSTFTTVEKATLCCRVYLDGTKYIMGCRHMLNGDNCDGLDVSNVGWGRLNNSGTVAHRGDAVEAYQKFDMALMNLKFPNSDEILYDIADEPSGGIVGRVTGDGIDYRQADSTPDFIVRKRGRTTCKTSGTIQEARKDVSPCIGVTEQNQIISSAEQKQGDSGGPVYIHRSDLSDPDDLYLLHIATRKTPDNGYAQGSSANVMNQQENVTFGGNPYNGQ